MEEKSIRFVVLVIVVLDEKLDKAESEDMCEPKELTLDGSAPFSLLPVLELLFGEEVLSANGWGCAFWEWLCVNGGGS